MGFKGIKPRLPRRPGKPRADEEPQRPVGHRIARWADEQDTTADVEEPADTSEDADLGALVEQFDKMIGTPDPEPEPEPEKKRRWLFRQDTSEFEREEDAAEPEIEPVAFELPNYHYRTRTEGLTTVVAWALEFPRYLSRGATAEEAIASLKDGLREYLTVEAAAGNPIPEPFDTSVDPDYAETLWTRQVIAEPEPDPFGERARKAWKNLWRRNRPDLQWSVKHNRPIGEAKAVNRRTGLVVAGWLGAAVVSGAILFGQSGAHFDAISESSYDPMLADGTLVTYSDPVKVADVKRGELVRVVREDQLVEFGVFAGSNDKGHVELLIPSLEDTSVVAPAEVARVKRTVPFVGPAVGVIESPIVAVAPLLAYGIGFIVVTRRRSPA